MQIVFILYTCRHTYTHVQTHTHKYKHIYSLGTHVMPSYIIMYVAGMSPSKDGDQQASSSSSLKSKNSDIFSSLLSKVIVWVCVCVSMCVSVCMCAHVCVCVCGCKYVHLCIIPCTYVSVPFGLICRPSLLTCLIKCTIC